MDLIEAEQGRLSDGGDKIVDKYSGYTISNIKSDSNEGFDEQGFVVRTRAVIEKSKEETIEEFLSTIDEIDNKYDDTTIVFSQLENEKQIQEKKVVKTKKRVFSNKINQNIYDIIYALKERMHINAQIDEDFIIQAVTKSMKTINKYNIVTEKQYKKSLKERKRN